MTNKTDKNSQTTLSGAQSQIEQLATDTNPAIYVACLAAYNTGKLHGRWIHANQDADAIWAEITEMLKQSPVPLAEEWAIHDYEGFGDYRLSENESIEEVAAMAENIAKHGDAYLAAVALAGDRAQADALLDEYCGEYNSNEDFVRQLLVDTDMLPKNFPVWIHIDWQATARDVMHDYVEHNGHYFRQS